MPLQFTLTVWGSILIFTIIASHTCAKLTFAGINEVKDKMLSPTLSVCLSLFFLSLWSLKYRFNFYKEKFISRTQDRKIFMVQSREWTTEWKENPA